MVAPLNTITPKITHHTGNGSVAITDNNTVTSSIVVSGADPVLLDFNLRTFITHTFPGDLDITITAPSGTVVTLTTDNGSDRDNVFNGTLWDDGANDPVTDHTFSNNVVASPLVPEGAFGAFVGEDPNGIWTISITDDAGADTGTLNSWAIDLTTSTATPVTQAQTFTNSTPAFIGSAAPNVVISTLVVSGLSANIFDLNLRTFIPHTFPADLDITLTSPAGTVVTLTTDNGGGNDNVFIDTLWDDDGGAPATDKVYANNVVAPTLVPEEAMAAFMGENPNGTWTLTVADDASGDGGTLSSWSLIFNTYADEPVVGGTSGADSFTALAGNERIDALGGVDTVTFGFALVDATVTYLDNRVIIEGPSSHTVTTGVERFVFTDGTVDLNDGNVLVDDLFYYAHNHDVWNAHVDADAHYNAFGRFEGRDPNAFFSIDSYLSLNQDVKAAGVDPLAHWHTAGWTEGRLPSFAFDAQQYLAANPDVAAAHVDPLEHFLAFGAAEGRQPFARSELIAANGFDSVYYLNHNPDVAAAQVDPFRHFMTVGWTEGRNPNALFDVNGYLAAYADVAAAHVNPLTHYDTFGWQEGRDPSVGFDTTSYLAANADVAAANVNPLTHFLQSGSHEGRSFFADGAFG